MPTKELTLLLEPSVSVFVRECSCVCCCDLENLSIGVCVFGVCDLEMLCGIWVGHSALDTSPMEVSLEAVQIPS